MTQWVVDCWNLGPYHALVTKKPGTARAWWASGGRRGLQLRLTTWGVPQKYEGIWMLTAKKKTNIIPTHRIVVVLIMSVVRDLSSSVMNKPDIKMAAKARTSSTLMLPGRSEKVGRVPTNVLDRGDVFLVSRFEIQKTSPESNAVQ